MVFLVLTMNRAVKAETRTNATATGKYLLKILGSQILIVKSKSFKPLTAPVIVF